MSRLDEVLPAWHFREHHTIEMDAYADTVFRAVEDVTWREVPVFRTLMALRMGRDPQSDPRVLASMLAGGFAVLDRLDNELVAGTLAKAALRGRVPLPADLAADAFTKFEEPGHLKIAFNFLRRGSTVTTETRVWATDERSRRAFQAYWLLIRGPSGLIRRVWLRAIRERAENEPVFL
ncbi:hypothetical protein [Yinghuangia seranimata]|uniref:hypothetical protein n=1 Tax=Yinghuangia seranimata TaxID=408067 RepID=UPI00248BA4BA|nr:hypothetical protein [Yinghuangia seranimata]MDI2127328.1 hypothetical protein [Yinghuangia seranimata]